MRNFEEIACSRQKGVVRDRPEKYIFRNARDCFRFHCFQIFLVVGADHRNGTSITCEAKRLHVVQRWTFCVTAMPDPFEKKRPRSIPIWMPQHCKGARTPYEVAA